MESHPPPPPLSTPITTTGPLPPPPQTAPQPHSNTSPPTRKPDSREEEPNGVKATNTTATATTTIITTANSKLRLMCRYGGYIVPRPYDRSLCYVGGAIRMVVVDRDISLSQLQFRLSKTLLDGNLFKLKYQLPSEDLDALICVDTDDDLEFMVQEYDRIVSSDSNAPRLRVFLFQPNFDPENSPSVESILGGSKNLDWFFTSLNWNIKKQPSVNCLLGLDDSVHISAEKSVETLIEANGSMKSGGKGGNSTQDLRSMQDSPMVDTTTSSYGSSSSATSVAVQVEEGGANPKGVVGLGIEEQFQQMNVVKKEEEPQLQQQQVVVAPQLQQQKVVVPPQLQQQQVVVPLQLQQHVKPSGGSDLPSPDSVTSDISVKNPLPIQSPVVYQEQSGAHIQSGNDRNFVDTNRVVYQEQSGARNQSGNDRNVVVYQEQSGAHIQSGNDRNFLDTTRMQLQQVHESGNDRNFVDMTRMQVQQVHESGNDRNFVDTTRMQVQQVHESGYVYPSHFDHQYQQLQHQHQQFVPARAQYIQHHHQPGTMPTVYYSLYTPPQQQHQQQLNRPPGMVEQHPYTVYLMPTPPQMPPPGTSEMAAGGVYRMPAAPPALPQEVQQSTPENGGFSRIYHHPSQAENGGVYRMPAAPPALPQEVQQQSAPENGGFARIYHHPSQAVNNPDYAAYRFVDPSTGHVYYTQQPLAAPHSATQYQTMAPPPPAATLSEVPPPRLSTEKH